MFPFTHSKRRSAPRGGTLADEVLSLCHRDQIEALARNPHLSRDVGLDCGTAAATPERLRQSWPF